MLVDLDGDNRNELVVGGSDGFVHAYRPDGSELPGWPVRGDTPPLHTGGRAFQSGAVSRQRRRRDPRVGRGRGPGPRRRPGGRRRRLRGQGLRLGRRAATACSDEGVEHRLLRQAAAAVRERAPRRSNPTRASAAAPSTASSARPCWPTSTATTARGSRSWPPRWTATSTPGTTTARRCPASRCSSSTRPRSPRSTPRRTRSRSTRTPARR